MRIIETDNRRYQRLSMRRPKQLYEINKKENCIRFHTRCCETCRQPILKHWILPFINEQLRSRFYCYRDGTQYSQGLVI